MDEAKEPMHKYTAFQCFGYELSLADRQYILSSGSGMKSPSIFSIK